MSWFQYRNSVVLLSSRKRVGLRAKCADYKPTKNGKVVRFSVNPQVKQTPSSSQFFRRQNLRNWESLFEKKQLNLAIPENTKNRKFDLFLIKNHNGFFLFYHFWHVIIEARSLLWNIIELYICSFLIFKHFGIKNILF